MRPYRPILAQTIITRVPLTLQKNNCKTFSTAPIDSRSSSLYNSSRDKSTSEVGFNEEESVVIKQVRRVAACKIEKCPPLYL